jgi:hypothetical protein
MQQLLNYNLNRIFHCLFLEINENNISYTIMRIKLCIDYKHLQPSPE